MSTSANQRVTRSASKARSTGAASTGAASVGAPSVGRSRRGGSAAPASIGAPSVDRSRRGGSAAPLAEDDKPAVGNQVTRAYGTEGESAQVQLLSAQIGMNQAVNPIANAVSKAQAPETSNTDTSGRLPALSEEPEASDHANQPFVDRMPYTIQHHLFPIDSIQSEPPAQPSFFSRLFWAPRRGGFNAEGPNRTANDPIAERVQNPVNELNEPRIDFQPGPTTYHVVHPWSWAELMKDLLIVCAFLLAVFWIYEGARTPVFGFGNESSFSKDLNESNASSRKFQLFNYRLTKVEKRMENISLNPQPSDATPELQINWFNPGFGTGVDLYLSSPTLSKCDPTWTPNGWPWSLFKTQSCPEVLLSAPQLEALTQWDDPVTDAWCAPPSNGKMQLAVVLPRTIAPTELVIEHAAMKEMPVGFMANSPKEVELWVHIADDTIRAAVLGAVRHLHPSLLEDSSPQNKAIGDQALPFDYVPVGRWKYNIWTNQRMQTFPVPFSLQSFGVSTDKVAVRVNSNWGNEPHTCVNRLRLHGEDTSGILEKLDERPAKSG